MQGCQAVLRQKIYFSHPKKGKPLAGKNLVMRSNLCYGLHSLLIRSKRTKYNQQGNYAYCQNNFHP
jgi:hypothetical protein